jgi:hypothetical protein
MSNTILTPTMITREALRVLHQKLNFIGSITREYDSKFSVDGAKIGTALNIRLPNQYTVRSGASLATQDTIETSTTLNVTTQKGVDLNFTSVDLTMSLDDFSQRIIAPAMAVLAANMESDAMTMYKDVYQQVNNTGAAITFNKVLQGRKLLVDALTPQNDRVCNLNTQDNLDLVDALKGLFQDSGNIAKQYKEGYMGRTGGFEFMENTLWPSHPRGAGTAAYVVSGASQTGSTVQVTSGTGALAQGDIVTFAGCNKVHPETKNSLGILQQFVLTASFTGGAGGMAISPAIVVSGPTQNVSATPTSAGAVTIAGSISTNYGVSLAYQKGAFVFATADLIMPNGVDFSARKVQDGLSMRIVRQYDINNDKFPCRLDVLYGFKTVRPQLAARLANN